MANLGYNNAAGAWESFPTTTATASHFTLIALFVEAAPAETPAADGVEDAKTSPVEAALAVGTRRRG